MALIKGPFTIKRGDNIIEDVEEISLDYTLDSEDFQTVQGKTYEIEGAQKAVIELTVLKSDIPTLAILVPQYHVPNGGTMSTGETVNNADGAIDVVPQACDTDAIYDNVDIISCGNPGQVLRLVNARSVLSGMDISNKLQTATVRLIGEPEGSEAALQMFKQGTIAVVS